MYAARRNGINKATCSQDIRRATIGLWEAIHGNINDQGIRKLRRCKSIECVGTINTDGKWETHTVYKLASMGGGYIFPINAKDIADFNSLVEEQAEGHKRAQNTAPKMISQGKGIH